MNAQTKSKGPWTHRFLVQLFTVVLAALIYWTIGFLLRDIGSLPGPDYAELVKRMLDPEITAKTKVLNTKIEDTERKIEEQRQRQAVLRDSTGESQRTMNQLLDFQRLALEKNVTPSQAEQQALAESQRLFLLNQDQYQLLNSDISSLNDQLRTLQAEQRAHNERLKKATEPITRQFEALSRTHDLKMAGLKLLLLIPMLCVAVWLFLKQRGSIYVPMIYAFGIAVSIKVGMVMHEYFPGPYFKYVLIAVALIIAARILVSLLRTIAFPKPDWLLKQYREAYERFFCPVCDFPIRRGPLKYLFWSRRSIKKLPILPMSSTIADAPYTCPMCGTRLFEECAACHSIRHSLLPACETCGHDKPLTSLPDRAP